MSKVSCSAHICKSEFKSAEQKAMSPQQIEAITEEVRKPIGNPDGSWIIADTCYEKFLHRICRSLGFAITNNHAVRMYFNSYVLIPKGIEVTNRAKLHGLAEQ